MSTEGNSARVRASDAEREEFAQIVREATGDGRLSLDEGDERLAQVYAAKYRDELRPLVADLPAGAQPEPSRRGGRPPVAARALPASSGRARQACGLRSRGVRRSDRLVGTERKRVLLARDPVDLLRPRAGPARPVGRSVGALPRPLSRLPGRAWEILALKGGNVVQRLGSPVAPQRAATCQDRDVGLTLSRDSVILAG